MFLCRIWFLVRSYVSAKKGHGPVTLYYDSVSPYDDDPTDEEGT